MQKQTVAFSRESSNLFFHILTKCNLSCTHCYINQDQHGADTLDIETIEAWLGLFSAKASSTNLIFLGGEPTLHPDLSLAVKAARRFGFKSITIDTNGYLFHDILDRISSDDIDYLSFSLDGATPGTNDAVRGKGSYGKVLEGIEKAVGKGFSCSMIYTVSERNLHELKQMPGLVRNLGIKRFFIQVIGIRGASAGHPLQVSREAWLDTIPETAEKMAGQGIIVTYPKVFLDPEDKFECAGNVAENFLSSPMAGSTNAPFVKTFPFIPMKSGRTGWYPCPDSMKKTCSG